MSEIIDRVALAIMDSREQQKDSWAQARAAIEAMREPSPDMTMEGESAGVKYLHEVRGNMTLKEFRPTVTAEIFRAMIDAALRT